VIKFKKTYIFTSNKKLSKEKVEKMSDEIIDNNYQLLPSTNINNDNMVRSIKILSLDGGGARCLLSLKILEILCKRLYGTSDDLSTKKFIDSFDFIAGTSGGSIIASFLCIGYSIDKIQKIFLEFNSKIFDNSWKNYPSKLIRYYRNGDFYNAESASQFLANFFSDINMNSLNKNLLIIATNATTNLFKPHFFRSYNLKNQVNNNYVLRNAIRASSSAPTYFASFKDVDNKTYIDGGVVANNPTLMAILESKELWYNCKIDLILSIGTGTTLSKEGSTDLSKLTGEFLRLLTNSEVIHHEVVEWLYGSSKDTKYFRFTPTGLGSIRLEESNKDILYKGELDTEKYMNSQEDKILDFVEKILN